jgi:hypothetical protein
MVRVSDGSGRLGGTYLISPDLLLLHELGVGTIVDNVTTEDGGGEGRVDFFGVDITQLAVEDELVALGA